MERTDANHLVVPGPSPAAPQPEVAREPLLRAQNVHRLLGTGDAVAHILKGVSLEIGYGEYTSIVGASGSGRVGWLVAMGIAVAAILIAAVVLAVRTDERPGMPGMDMGRHPSVGLGADRAPSGSRL